MLGFEELLNRVREIYGSAVHQFDGDTSYFYVDTLNLEFHNDGTIRNYIECHDCGNSIQEVIAENKTIDEMLNVLTLLS